MIKPLDWYAYVSPVLEYYSANVIRMAYVITRHESTNGKYRLSSSAPMTMIGEYTDLGAAKGAADEHWKNIIREFLED